MSSNVVEPFRERRRRGGERERRFPPDDEGRNGERDRERGRWRERHEGDGGERERRRPPGPAPPVPAPAADERKGGDGERRFFEGGGLGARPMPPFNYTRATKSQTTMRALNLVNTNKTTKSNERTLIMREYP